MRFVALGLVCGLLGCGTMPPVVQESRTSEGALELADQLRARDLDGALGRFLLGRGLSDEKEEWVRGFLSEELLGFIETIGIPDDLEPTDPRDDLVREGVVLARRISPLHPQYYFFVGKSVFLTSDASTYLVIGFVCHSGKCRISEVAWGVPADSPEQIRRLRSAHEEAIRRRWDFREANPRPE